MNRDLIKLAEAAALAGGETIRKYFRQTYTVGSKGPGNPVTSADLEADALLKTALLDTCPDYGWLSEESTDSVARLSKQRVWIVDPLDGTKEFIAGRPEFVVSIGLVEDGRPIIGVLFNPITGELFSAQTGRGAFLNGKSIHSTQTVNLSDAKLIVSRTELADNLWQKYRRHFGTLEPCGSVAYKLTKVATGAVDLHISLKPKNEWDICAAHCLLNEAGAALIGRDGLPVTYNRKNPIIHSGLIAGNRKLVEKVLNID